MMIRSAAKACLALVVTATLGLPTHSAYAAVPRDEEPLFTLAEIHKGNIADIATVSGNRLHDLTVARSSDGTLAIVDRSMLDHGVVAAAGPSFVDLSWTPHSKTTRYGISRDGAIIGKLPVGVTGFRDMSVVSGKTYRYNIVPLLEAATAESAQMWSMLVRVPVRPSTINGASNPLTLSPVALAAVAPTTTVSWVTFIPQARIDAPSTGCSYGSGYQFGGDNRGYDWTSSSYRTAVHAVITWASKSVAGYTSVGSTTVYRKSDGAYIDQRTASINPNNMYARKLGSGSNYVDVRMSTYASNPYCSFGAIAGAVSMHLTTSGNYSVISGSHRQMPNHHVYIYDGGSVTDVYRRNYANVACLIGPALCPEAPMHGAGIF